MRVRPICIVHCDPAPAVLRPPPLQARAREEGLREKAFRPEYESGRLARESGLGGKKVEGLGWNIEKALARSLSGNPRAKVAIFPPECGRFV